MRTDLLYKTPAWIYEELDGLITAGGDVRSKWARWKVKAKVVKKALLDTGYFEAAETLGKTMTTYAFTVYLLAEGTPGRYWEDQIEAIDRHMEFESEADYLDDGQFGELEESED